MITFCWRRIRITGRAVPIHRIKVLPTDSPTACFNLFYSKKTDLILDKTSIPTELVEEIKSKPYFHANPLGQRRSFVSM